MKSKKTTGALVNPKGRTLTSSNRKRTSHVLAGRRSVLSLILVSLSKECDSFVQNYNMHGMGKTVNELHAMLKLHEQTLPKKNVAHALHTIRAGLWYLKGIGVETIVYADFDHAGDYVDQKSTSGVHIPGMLPHIVDLQEKTAPAISTTEAEYISTRKACQQALWMKQALVD
uniref:Zinc finger, CCHC-type n=1 Tax=Tanacetum cinerariifolium TaxID=118510 RepID=A0A699GWL0_TANCI|nr:zinc finger, CCHC-type [Tanacetum cinerariifolium]